MADTIPGSTSSTAVLAVNSYASSEIDHFGDTDWWQVNLVAGQNYVFDLTGWYSVLGTLFDPYLWVLSSSGSVLDFDDDSGAGLESRVVFTPAISGTYFVAAGEAGHDATGTYTLVAATDHGNTLGSAASLPLNAPATGSVQYAGDVDLFAVSAPASSLLTFAFDAPAGAPAGAFDLRVYNAGGGLVKGLVVNGDSTVVVGAPVGGTYYFQVGSGTGYTEAPYTVTAASQAFDFSTQPTTQILPFTGDHLVDATLHGYYWALNASRTITWAIADSGSAFFLDPVNALDRVDDALATYESVANIHFQRLGYYSSVDAARTSGADIVVSMDGGWQFFSSSSQWAWAFFPDAQNANSPYPGAAGDVWINLNSDANTLSYQPGASGFFLLLHELGHALGLKHPHDGGGTGHPTYAAAGLGNLDIDWASVMSYEDDVNWTNLAWEPATPMLLDVLAMQALYGQNNSTNAGDSTHFLLGNNKYQSIWDASGNDTVSASGSSFGWTVQLSEPASTLALNTSITTPVGYALGYSAFASYPTLYWLVGNIENAIGSNQDDDLAGNGLSNVLIGMAGSDSLSGGGGSDYLEGGPGADSLHGGPGNDSYQYSLGGGRDTLTDIDGTPGNQDTVLFGSGILPVDVGVYRSGSDLVLARRGSYDQDRVTLQQFDLGATYQIEQVTFTGDATVWTPAYLLSHVEQAGTVLAQDNGVRSSLPTAASGLFQIADPDGGSPYSYELWDGGAGGGYFRVGGAQQAAGMAIPVSAAQFAATDYFGGAAIGSETVYVRAYDGLLWTGWASWTMYTHNRASNNVPVVNVANRNIDLNQWRLITELVGISDADGDGIIQYQLRDVTGTAGSGSLWANGVQFEQGATFTVASLANTWVRGGGAAGADTYEVRAFDGVGWSGWTSFSLNTRTQPNRAPAVTPTAANQTAVIGQPVGASTLSGFNDLDGDSAFSYVLWDSAGGGYFRVGGNPQPAGQSIVISAAQLATTEYVGGATSGAETVWAQTYDGQAWSPWASWTMQTVRASNADPVANASNRNVDLNQWRLLSELVSTTDADGDAIVAYEVRDLTATANSGYLWANGASQPANTVVSFTDLASAWVRGGASAGADTYEVRARDSEGAWSTWTPFTITTRTIANRAPVAEALDNAVQVGQTVALGTLFSVADADGDVPLSYELWDGGAGGGRFRVDGVDQAGGVAIPITAAQLATGQYVAGAAPGSETLWVRATDGQAWSGWEAWTMGTHNNPGNSAPVVTAANRNIDLNQWRLITELVSVTDAESNPIGQYQVRDTTGTANSGLLWADGVQYGQGATVTLSSLGNTWVRGGATAGADIYEVRAFDGITWGAWTPFTLTTRAQANRAPVVNPTAPTQNVGLNTPVVASALFGVTDADVDAPFSFELWDGGAGGGLFNVSGVDQPAGQSLALTSAQFAATTYVGGASPGSETLWARVNDGQTWSGWVAWTMNSA